MLPTGLSRFIAEAATHWSSPKAVAQKGMEDLRHYALPVGVAGLVGVQGATDLAFNTSVGKSVAQIGHQIGQVDTSFLNTYKPMGNNLDPVLSSLKSKASFYTDTTKSVLDQLAYTLDPPHLRAPKIDEIGWKQATVATATNDEGLALGNNFIDSVAEASLRHNRLEDAVNEMVTHPSEAKFVHSEKYRPFNWLMHGMKTPAQKTPRSIEGWDASIENSQRYIIEIAAEDQWAKAAIEKPSQVFQKRYGITPEHVYKASNIQELDQVLATIQAENPEQVGKEVMIQIAGHGQLNPDKTAPSPLTYQGEGTGYVIMKAVKSGQGYSLKDVILENSLKRALNKLPESIKPVVLIHACHSGSFIA